jgi:hypothetical protein
MGLLSSPAPPQTELSTGATAGIGVGCAVAAIAAALIVWMLFRSRNRKRRVTNNESPTIQVVEPQPVKDKDPHVELADEVALQEMTGHERQTQPGSVHTRAELM